MNTVFSLEGVLSAYSGYYIHTERPRDLHTEVRDIREHVTGSGSMRSKLIEDQMKESLERQAPFLKKLALDTKINLLYNDTEIDSEKEVIALTKTIGDKYGWFIELNPY